MVTSERSHGDFSGLKCFHIVELFLPPSCFWSLASLDNQKSLETLRTCPAKLTPWKTVDKDLFFSVDTQL